MKKSLFLLLLILALVSGAFSQAPAVKDSPELRQKLQAVLDEWHKLGKFPGATAGIMLADGTSFGLAVGLSDKEANKAMKPGDIMLSGSVGKTYAAAVAMQLVSEGKLVLDERVEKYLGSEPWFSRLPNAKDITVRQLMNHTSGLVRYEFKEQFTKDLTAEPARVWKPQDLITYVLDTKAPFEAGKGWEYSDTNYIVLGMVMEKITGKKFYDLARTRVLEPLKLKNTAPSDSRETNGLVQGYAGATNPFGGKDAVIENGKFIINPQFEWTGGGYASTAEDIARWGKMMYEGKGFPPAMLPEMLTGAAAPMLGRDSKYGLGVIIRQTRAGTSYGHSGFFPGYMTDMMYFPEHKIAVAVQVNTSVGQNLGKPLGRVAVELLEAIVGAKPAETAAQAPKKQFIIVLKLNEKYQDDKVWTEADNKAVQGHFARLQKLQADGKLVLAGRTTVKASMGVVILEVDTEAEARKVMEDDDAVKAGIMSAELLPFHTALMKR